MSRVPIWCEIVCVDCATQASGQFTYGAVPRQSLKNDAIKRGWKFKHDECFCSNRCLVRWEQEQGIE
ncbi:hypothetical protein PHIN3_176 [Sinorhizobium phage phiN3]|uniref:Uncharacterized protein n=1 Tax=Sinorhizobium phage phiN3 TaxID=1647405 RepID=A0A0F6WCQ7_9CAUD|nr:hypothetical protein AVT40_gp357 [Sinorhizobium phage phiN3]AKF13439.1 hypothetical protein PHIN3_176 [Sinorhizobium phage phiN3]